MKLSIPAVCWECRQPMAAGEFYQLTRTPDGTCTWQPHHDPQQGGCATARPAAPQGGPAPETDPASKVAGSPVSARMEGRFGVVHVTRGDVELVWPCPPDMMGLKLVDLISNLRAVAKLVAP